MPGTAAAWSRREPVITQRSVELGDLVDAVSSPVRSRGIVVTTTPPALSTPNQHAASHWLLGPRSSTRLPGTMPRSSVSTLATWAAAGQIAVAPGLGRRQQAAPAGAARLDRRVSRASAAFSRSGYVSSGSVNSSSGHWSAAGRLSRQNVSVCADGDSCMSGPPRMPPGRSQYSAFVTIVNEAADGSAQSVRDPHGGATF